MSLRVQCVTVDSSDPARAARFWAAALGWEISPGSTGDEAEVRPPAGSPAAGVAADLLFLRVPEGKAVKNRLHLDLAPAPASRDGRDAEVARLEGLGAVRADVGQGPDVTWVVLADPDGNEFCVLGPAPESG